MNLTGWAMAAVLVVGAEVEKGPHGGTLFEGAKHKYHIELTVDAAAKTATAYVLDGKAKNAVPLPGAMIQVKVKGLAAPIELAGVAGSSKKEGTFSRYAGKHDRFGEKLDFEQIEILAVIAEGKPPITFKPEVD